MTMSKLNTVHGDNIYCGPAIISAVTGKSTTEIAAMIQELRRNKNPVVGVWDHELETIYNKLGYRCVVSANVPRGTSLFNALCSITSGIWAIVVPGHYVCVEVDSDGKRWFIDNHTKRPMSAAASARGMQKVIWIRKIVKKEDE